MVINVFINLMIIFFLRYIVSINICKFIFVCLFLGCNILWKKFKKGKIRYEYCNVENKGD